MRRNGDTCETIIDIGFRKKTLKKITGGQEILQAARLVRLSYNIQPSAGAFQGWLARRERSDLN